MPLETLFDAPEALVDPVETRILSKDVAERIHHVRFQARHPWPEFPNVVLEDGDVPANRSKAFENQWFRLVRSSTHETASIRRADPSFEDSRKIGVDYDVTAAVALIAA